MGNDHGRLELTRRGMAGAGLAMLLGACVGAPGSQRAVIRRDWYRLAGTDQLLRVEELTDGHYGYYLYRENPDGSLTETGVSLQRGAEVEYRSGTDPHAVYHDRAVERDLIAQPRRFTEEERALRGSLGLSPDIHTGE